MIAQRNFTVKGTVSCRYAPDGTAITNNLENIEIELWRKNPLDIIFLGKGITDSTGVFKIEFELDSPNPIIVNGKIEHVFIKAFYNGIPTQVDQSIEAGTGSISAGNLISNGTIWRSGATAPDNGLGLNGDYYLRTSNGDVYERILGTYTIVANIKGATGATGATGAAGATGATGATGAAGTNGSNGTNGRTILNGTIDPAGGTGADGDFYINTSTSKLFGPKTGTSWPAGISLIGPKGDDGTNGADGTNGSNGANGADGSPGSVWRNDDEDPDNSIGVDGDYFLNTSNGNVFKKSGSTYTLQGNIKGPSAPVYRNTSEIKFDVQAEYGSESNPLTDDFTFDSSGAVVGISVLIIHEGGAPTFPTEFQALKNSLTYTTSGINYITCTYRSSSLVTYTINWI